MTLDAFGRVIGIRPVTETFKVEFKNYWQCHFPGVQYESPSGGMVHISGRGPVGRRARIDFVSRIRGKTLVVGFGTFRERKFPVPDSLTE